MALCQECINLQNENRPRNRKYLVTSCTVNNDGLHHSYNDKPARVIYCNDVKISQWHKNGMRHRTTGPAVKRSCGYKSWYLDGEYYTEKEFQNKKSEKKLKEKKATAILEKDNKNLLFSLVLIPVVILGFFLRD